MNHLVNAVSCCRLCKHYDPTGRRGGNCEKLDVPVHASWAACSLAISPFVADWETSAEIASVLPSSILIPVLEREKFNVAVKIEKARSFTLMSLSAEL